MSSASTAKELAELVQQFLSHHAENNTELSSVSRESLAVAAECIEQAFELQRRPASDKLLRIYESHKRAGEQQTSQPAQASSSATAAAGTDTAPNQMPPWANMFPDLVSQMFNMAAGAGLGQVPGQGPTTTTSAPNTQATPSPASSAPAAPAPPPKVRKQPTQAEKLAADAFKNQGNELMKEDKFKEAHECYTRAIEINDNNAIYYSNRAAASSKLGDHHAALRDCDEAIEIDPTYSKAYGRKALAHASLDEHQKAKEAYAKAVELDPNNESYRNNLRIAEERLAEEAPNVNAPGGQQNLMANMMRLMNNPEFMQMATRSLQDPRLRTLIGSAMASLSPQTGGGAPPNQ